MQVWVATGSTRDHEVKMVKMAHQAMKKMQYNLRHSEQKVDIKQVNKNGKRLCQKHVQIQTYAWKYTLTADYSTKTRGRQPLAHGPNPSHESLITGSKICIVIWPAGVELLLPSGLPDTLTARQQ